MLSNRLAERGVLMDYAWHLTSNPIRLYSDSDTHLTLWMSTSHEAITYGHQKGLVGEMFARANANTEIDCAAMYVFTITTSFCAYAYDYVLTPYR